MTGPPSTSLGHVTGDSRICFYLPGQLVQEKESDDHCFQANNFSRSRKQWSTDGGLIRMDSSVPRKRGPEHRILDPDDQPALSFLLSSPSRAEEEGRGYKRYNRIMSWDLEDKGCVYHLPVSRLIRVFLLFVFFKEDEREEERQDRLEKRAPGS